MNMRAKRWAAKALLADLAEVRDIGFACNVQDWAQVGVAKSVAECRARRREARRLLKIALEAVRMAAAL